MKSWLKGMMFRHIHGMMSCREFEDFVQAYIDGELPERQRTVMERHMRLCRECREYLAAYKKAMEIGHSVLAGHGVSLPADVPEDLISAILEAREG